MILVKSNDKLYLKTKKGLREVIISSNYVNIKDGDLQEVIIDFNSGDLKETKQSTFYIG